MRPQSGVATDICRTLLLNQLEDKFAIKSKEQDSKIQGIFNAIRKLMLAEEKPKKIGFIKYPPPKKIPPKYFIPI